MELIHKDINNEKNNDTANEHHHEVSRNHSRTPYTLAYIGSDANCGCQE